jgi:uncharacterized protein (DUF433 family)
MYCIGLMSGTSVDGINAVSVNLKKVKEAKMTHLLAEAFKKAQSLPESIQDELAKQLIEDIENEFQWQKTLSQPQSSFLDELALKALSDSSEGKTTGVQFQATTPPFRWDEAGGIRIGQSRVTLDSILAAYHNGSTPEEIAVQYSVISLEDIYTAIAYYLNHRQEIDNYLQKSRTKPTYFSRGM